MEVVVLAAGQGKRMRSILPKVLQPIAGKPMLAHVLDAARTLDARRICVVYGHGGEVVRERLDAADLDGRSMAERSVRSSGSRLCHKVQPFYCLLQPNA